MGELPDGTFSGGVGTVLGIFFALTGGTDFGQGGQQSQETEQEKEDADADEGQAGVAEGHIAHTFSNKEGEHQWRNGPGQLVGNAHDADAPGGTFYGTENGDVGIHRGLQKGVAGTADEGGEQKERETL